MKVIDISSVNKAMGGATRTVQDFGAFLGSKPHKLGLVATLYDDLSATYLTDSLMNVYFNESKGGQFQPIDSMTFEWDLDVNYIKKVYFAEDTTDTGLNKSTIRVVFSEHYYDKGDTFVLENRQQLFVTQTPRMIAPQKWEYICTLVGNNLSETLDTNFATKGRYTRWRSNYHPELSERGYSKFTSNVEKHRGHISLHRASVASSQEYNALEDVYIQVARGKYSPKGDEEMFYKLNKKEKDCLDSLYYAKNQHILFGKSNHDVNGKCLDFDDQGRKVPMGKLHCPLAA